MKLFLTLLSFLLVTQVARAELLVVDSTGDQPAVNPNVSAITAVATITLRSAIQRANANADASNTINFAIPQADVGYQPTTDHWIIQPQSGLPTIALKQMIIDGYTQVLGVTPASPNTNPIDLANNARVKIELRGPGPNLNQFTANGLSFLFADDSIVRGLIINNWAGVGINLNTGAITALAAGISVIFSNDVISEGCFFGTDVTGIQSMPNSNAIIFGLCEQYLLGGLDPAARNLLSGSYTGIAGVIRSILSLNGSIQGNTIGLDRSGTQVLTGFDSRIGIVVDFSEDSLLIGGNVPEARNVIAGGATYNILIAASASNTVVQGNYIGTDITGTKGFEENGVGVLPWDVVNTTIRDNLISGNSKGIVLGQNTFSVPPAINTLVQNNIIGLDATGTQSVPNRDDGIYLNFARDTIIADNTISANDANGIRVEFARNTTITGNKIGTNIFGTGVLGNGRNGIQLGMLLAANIPTEGDVIGGPNEEDRNIISGNKLNGISIQSLARNETVTNNFIGSSVTGDQFARPNEKSFGNCKNGIEVACANENTLTDNLIEFNKCDGIKIKDNANQNVVQGNDIHDNCGDGVEIRDSSCNLIGGLEDLSCSVECALVNGNIIHNNGGHGVVVIERCGTAVDNAILSNTIFDNGKDAIKLLQEKCEKKCVKKCSKKHDKKCSKKKHHHCCK